jgi:CDGSH-type Zn-finger protein
MRGAELAAIISICEDGPLIIRGNFELREMADGRRINTERRVIALCRCGRSQIKPFCDGSHAYPSRTADRQAEQSQ